MSLTPYRVAILVISDTATASPSTDLAGPALKDEISQADTNEWETPEIKIVPDDVLDIQRSILQWTDGPSYMNLILTTGGTGFAVRDVTPEVGIQEARSVTVINANLSLLHLLGDYLSAP